MFYAVQTTKTADASAQAVYAFATLDEAKSNYHYFLSSSYVNAELTYFMGTVLDEVGQVVMRESWFAPVPEEETEEVTE